MIDIDLTTSAEKAIPFGENTLVVEGKLFEGDVCDFYEALYIVPQTQDTVKWVTWFDLLDQEDELRIPALLKVAKSASDNDLVQNEAQNLPVLFPPGAADEKFYRYFNKMLLNFQVGIGGRGHEAVVVGRVKGWLSLAEILAAYPNGVDFRDMVWMWKRQLVGLGFTHLQGLIHGAVLPPHTLVHPTGHGAKLIDWKYAVKQSAPRVRALSAKWEGYYAPEIPGRRDVSTATDIYMSAKCALALVGGDVATNKMPDSVPEPIQKFILECLDPDPRMRPKDAWDLHEEFDKLLRRVVGKPVYRPFSMPGGSP